MLVKVKSPWPKTPIAKIPLQNDFVAFCDPKRLSEFNRVHWYAKKSRGLYYVCAKVVAYGQVGFLRMHRIVAHTPPGMIPHHLNGNTLDNREANLLNVTEYEHKQYFSYR